MTEEIIIHEEPDIKITNLRAVIGNKTYPIANITSVGVETQTPSGLLPIVLILGGIMALMVSIPTFTDSRTWDDSYGVLTFGIFAIVAGVAILRANKPTYVLQLSTAAGEVKALTSPDQAHIQKISEALNTAIIQKG